MKIRIFLLVVILVNLAACAQEPIDPYSLSTYSNQRLLQTLPVSSTQINISIMPHSLYKNKLVCLGKPSVFLIPHETFSHYIEKSLIRELQASGHYSRHASKKLIGQLNEVSFQGGAFNLTTWTIQMTFSPSHQSPFTITAHYPFANDIHDPRFCQQVTDAFPSAVQYFIRQLIISPEFYTFWTT